MAYYRVGLTTVDNPFNPITEFDDWIQHDIEHGHGTCEYLARICMPSDQLSDAENAKEVERAIDAIIKADPLNLYKKVKVLIDD